MSRRSGSRPSVSVGRGIDPRSALLILALCATPSAPALAAYGFAVPDGPPRASVDLATPKGTALMKGTWRYSDTKVIEVPFRAAGADGQPTGPAITTYDIVPHAGGIDYDDSNWEVLEPAGLARRRATGRICFNWYRIAITVPASIDGVDTTGTTLVFQTTLDDYAEVWVDGELARGLGQPGGSIVGGWNAPNRLVVGHDVRPGQVIQLAIFGANGPLSNPPTNFIWMREARLELYDGPHGPVLTGPQEVNLEIERLDPAMDAIVGPNPKLFKLAQGFDFTEGPVWVPDGGYLLFSDPNRNLIYRYVPDQKLEVFRSASGYDGADVERYHQPGSNGLALAPDGRLTIDQHGNRRVVRLEGDGSLTVLADRFEGKRLNSPNDLVYRSDGTLYFSDPPFGLPKVFDDPGKELTWSGVFMVPPGGQPQLVTKELSGPNGIALSPDERTLYVGDWDDHKKVVMRYDLTREGIPSGPGTVLFDMTSAPGEDAIDGIKVDRLGNLYVSGPGGLWVISPAGRHLGTIRGPRHAHNMAWGDDGKSLYLCAREALYRLPLKVEGFVTPRRGGGASSGG